MREHGTEEQYQLVALDQQRREVFDVPVLDARVFVFDIHPDETNVGILRLQLAETGLVFTAGAAPGGAQADDEEFSIQGG